MKKVLVVFGTRPETVKLAPVLRELAEVKGLRTRVCVTAQHRGMLDQMLSFFRIKPHDDLDLMRRDQALDEILDRALRGLRPLLRSYAPDLLVVQGDTTTALAAALAAFHRRIPVAHVEAGLRSFDLSNPYPEEMNRLLIDRASTLLFAPTETARDNLRREGLSGPGVFVTGNTAVDALRWARGRAAAGPAGLRPDADVVLVTLHRRESFGRPMTGVFRALREIAERAPNAQLVYPVHPNPHVHGPAYRLLRHPRILLCRPLSYPALVSVMSRCAFVLTDSGGLQEEAPAFAKPVLVARRTTERTEILEAGIGRLVGTDPERIRREALRLLADPSLRRRMGSAPNPYGDGAAARRIAQAIAWHFGLGRRPKDWKPRSGRA